MNLASLSFQHTRRAVQDMMAILGSYNTELYVDVEKRRADERCTELTEHILANDSHMY